MVSGGEIRQMMEVMSEEICGQCKEYGKCEGSIALMRPEMMGEISVAREMGRQYGVEFLYRDFRPLFQEGQRFAREHGFYMQKYCGCIFSEEDRYMAAKRKKKAAAVG